MNAPLVVISWILVVAVVSGLWHLTGWAKDKIKAKSKN